MNMPWSKLQGSSKLMAICAAVLLVSGGLCGTQVLVLSLPHGMANSLGPVFMITGVLELIAMLVSALVGFVALLVWAFNEIFGRGGDS